MPNNDPKLVRGFAFQVKLRPSSGAPEGASPSGQARASGGASALGDGGFQECSGLEIEMDVQEHLEGGRNDGVIQLVGRAKYQRVTLKRGMFFATGGKANSALWTWLQGIVSGEGPVRRYDGVVEVLSGDKDQRVVATWVWERGLPVKVSGPTLQAQTGEIAIEELQIAHEGLRLM